MAPAMIEEHGNNIQDHEPVSASKSMKCSSENFNPDKHLAYQPPARTHTLKDLHLDDSPISPIGSTDPFPFLSAESVRAFRRELFSPDVLANCMYHTRSGSVQIRGMTPRYAPFTHGFWTSPEVLGIMSSLAGVDLVPVMDHEIAHINVQLGPNGVDGVKDTPVEPPEAPRQTETNDYPPKAPEVDALVPWHRDSHPFVCVVMLSDARYMTGGETELRKGDGTTIRVKSPGIGGAVVLQGRHVSHLAIPAGNMPERITMVTSFRPRSPLLLDDSTCMNVRTKSCLSELYYQWTEYRLRLLSERFQHEADHLRRRYADAVRRTDPDGLPGHCLEETVNLDYMKSWMEEQIWYMRQTLFEMRPVTAEDNVLKDTIERGDLLI
ncbi:hypothetical protein NECHADRAFT_17752 [Paecilomyces variotii No. 5]|uniref:Fe2OG dioxygenase domain-containing protein n=1 Tax=Byssochlamys spectabilis (strain No. 5 / NBRC 109023) TaxID=1356009 RepID=V5GBC3_BYSSN|nr:hypothetical protein NECHADRAFT_17752 [Paecilomyces variotii No. 5]